MAARLLGRVAGAAMLASLLAGAAVATAATRSPNAAPSAAGVPQEGESLGPARLGVPAFTDDAAEPADEPFTDETIPVLAPDPAAPAGGDPPPPGAAPDGQAPAGEPAPGAPGTAPSDAATPPATSPDGTPPAAEPTSPAAVPPETAPSATPPADEPGAPADLGPDAFPPTELEPGKEVQTPSDPSKPLPEIHLGEEGLPEPVKKTRQAILDAARTGDIEALRPVLEMNEMPPTLSKDDVGDPIAYLKGISGDLQGREILAILVDLLEAGWVVENPGTPQEMYVWPYFADIPVDRLTPPQLVELYRILTSADVDEMQAYDTWLFFKIGIGPDGTWHYFTVSE